MPELGEIKRSETHYNKSVWAACINCGYHKELKGEVNGRDIPVVR